MEFLRFFFAFPLSIFLEIILSKRKFRENCCHLFLGRHQLRKRDQRWIALLLRGWNFENLRNMTKFSRWRKNFRFQFRSAFIAGAATTAALKQKLVENSFWQGIEFTPNQGFVRRGGLPESRQNLASFYLSWSVLGVFRWWFFNAVLID